MKKIKEKKCKTCYKSFLPRNTLQKFCSPKCYWESKKGEISKKRNGKNIKCKYCKKEFYISGSRIGVKKYCSDKCYYKDNPNKFKPKDKKCVICEKVFTITESIKKFNKTCSDKCHYDLLKISAEKVRKAERKTVKDWKNYKNGKHIDRGLHSRICAKYRENFKKKHEYIFCEKCKVNINGTPRFETHHIVYASEAPKHKYLHDDRNLILLCTSCHHLFH